MKKVITLISFAILLGPDISLCAAPPVQEDQVGGIVTSRTGMAFFPTGDPACDEQLTYAITTMLQDGLTKDEAVQIALYNNRKLQSRLADLGMAAADLIEAGMLSNPVFEYVRRSTDAPGDGDSIEFSVVQSFLDLLMIPLRKKVAKAEFQRVRAEIAADVLNAAFDTQKAFYDLQGAANRATLLKKQVEALSVNFAGAAALNEAGNISDYEYHEQQLALNEQKLNLADLESQIVELREKLNMQMGLWGPAVDWTIAPALPSLPRQPVPSEGLETIAICQRLDLEVARMEIEAAARKAGIADITGLIPALDFGLVREREPDGTRLRGYSIEGEIPIFNQGQGKISRSRAKLFQAQADYYAKAVEVRAEVRSARAQMARSRERVQYYREEVMPLQERLNGEALLMFNAMELDLFELLQIKKSQIQTEQDSIKALQDYWVNYSMLEKALGGSLTCPQMIPVSEPARPMPPASARQKQMPSQQMMKGKAR